MEITRHIWKSCSYTLQLNSQQNNRSYDLQWSPYPTPNYPGIVGWLCAYVPIPPLGIQTFLYHRYHLTKSCLNILSVQFLHKNTKSVTAHTKYQTKQHIYIPLCTIPKHCQ